MGMQPVRVGVSGSYGGLNLGDEAILEVIVRQLRASLPAEITVFSRDTEDTLRRHDVDHAVPVRQMTREEARAEVEKLDLLLLGGGGILYDRDVELHLREVALAYEAQVPVVVYAISAGPLNDPNNRKLVAKHLSRAAAITMATGQAAGVCAALAAQRHLRPRDIPPGDVQTELLRQGADLGRQTVGF